MNDDAKPFTCPDLAMRASEYLDGELQANQCRRFDEHQKLCPACRGMITSLRRTIEGIRCLADEPSPSRVKDLVEETMLRMRERHS